MFLDGVSSTARVIELVNNDYASVQGVLVLNPARVEMKSNTWASYRERTAFAQDPLLNISVQISDSEGAENIDGLRLLILHETGHLIATQMRLMPETYADADPEDTKNFSYLQFGWKFEGDSRVSLFDTVMPTRSKVSFYSDSPRLLSADAGPSYKSLKNTSYVSLYGATATHEDFAESFAHYVHSVVLKRPYRVLLNGMQILGSCYKEKRCDGKKAYFEQVMKLLERDTLSAKVRTEGEAPGREGKSMLSRAS